MIWLSRPMASASRHPGTNPTHCLLLLPPPAGHTQKHDASTSETTAKASNEVVDELFGRLTEKLGSSKAWDPSTPAVLPRRIIHSPGDMAAADAQNDEPEMRWVVWWWSSPSSDARLRVEGKAVLVWGLLPLVVRSM